MRKSFFLLAALLSSPLLLSQSVNPPTISGLRIGKGDLIQIDAFQEDSLKETVRVDDMGVVPLRIGGSVNVEGLTPAEASKRIEGILRDGGFLLDPHVLVTINEYVTQKVAVTGEVQKPGTFELTTPLPVNALIAMAGGITQLADRNVMVQRHGTGQVLTYFLPNNVEELQKLTIEIQPGDTLVVPKAKLVYVLGDVKVPGGYTMTTNDSRLSVLQLIARAEGTNNSAVPSHAKLIRKLPGGGYEKLPLPLSAMQKGNANDQQLEPDDIVWVPFSYIRSIAVSGVSGIPSSLASTAVYRF